MRPEIRKGLRTIVASREFTRRAGSKSARVRIEIGSPQHLRAEPDRACSAQRYHVRISSLPGTDWKSVLRSIRVIAVTSEYQRESNR